jgi:hypothetical protein
MYIVLFCGLGNGLLWAQENFRSQENFRTKENFRSQRFLDSIYNKYISEKNYSVKQKNHSATYGVFEGNPDFADHKCGFPLTGLIHSNFRYFSSQQQKNLKILDERPKLDTSILSPSGHFRIHYDNSGVNKPQYDANLSVQENVNQLALALDSAYSFEVNFLGFPPPPIDSMRGGDNAYDIYIEDMGDYGNTSFENEIAPGKWNSYIAIDNDFKEVYYYTHGFDAARVTVAHEFNHAIQIGNYNYRDADLFFHELTSTSMEEFVFNTSNDYYGYLRNYFNAPEKTFSEHNGYDLAIWNIYLKEIYGFPIIKRQWEFYINNPALSAINSSIVEASNGSSSFKTELSTFGIWSFYTDYRAVSGKYFPEAINYPPIKIASSSTFSSTSFPLQISSQPLSNYFIDIFVPGNNRTDTITTKITGGDLARALENPGNNLLASFTLSSDSTDGARKVVNNYFAKFSSSRDVFLETYFFNNQIVQGNLIEYAEIDNPYPNPFNYKNAMNNNQLSLPVSYNEMKNADVYIYSSGMNLVYSGNRNIFADPLTNKFVITWNGMDSSGKKLPTGVYIYITNSNGNLKKGKIVIKNE